ncbi:ABC transporter ATP-binding protein [Corynebacterium uberis]|uniref:ABC transporter ATP-binding protein n=1 Tax=Corynebacterium uberis TaxID=2883169 RepID=UPI001D0AB16C|nr:ABC transporter ATP-binding protein [Corynebacterium uberis]UDL76724.1 ABC transporter ATP-binding protein [Corynebacterium uberis]UDL81215.1 ABC transporter ATP-binding protein [Corynebacterium uberis]
MEDMTATVTATGGPLVAEDITKDYGSGPILGGVSLRIEQGELVAVMGPSGSGKSTLLHCLSGILVPTSGRVWLGEQEISALPDAQRSRSRLRNLGFVFQDGQLIPELSAVENVALPLQLDGTRRGLARRKAQEALDKLGLGELATRRPGQLSGGQMQRVAVARAIAGNPAIIFADEPTGALDQATGHEVMQLLTTVLHATGGTLVMVTHDRNVAGWCDRLVEIRDGIVHHDSAAAGQEA